MRTVKLAVLALSLSACGVSQKEFAAKDSELQKYQKMYGDEAVKSKSLEAKVAEQDAALAAKQANLKAVEDEKAAAEARASSLAVSNAQRERLAQSLQQQIKSGQVEISELRGKMTVKLKDKVLFASGSAALGKEGKKALDAVAEAFKDLKDRNVVVAGYTDNMPVGKESAFKDNWDLSTARAVAVVRYLASKGVDSSMLGAVGFSQYRPVVPNDTAANRSLNRRIEIALTSADYIPPTIEVPKK
jgi:chemotaxis protein MotB